MTHSPPSVVSCPSLTCRPSGRILCVRLGARWRCRDPQEWSKQQQARWRPAHPLTLNQRANTMKATQAPVPSIVVADEQPIPVSTERTKSMSAVSNFATFVPGTKTPGSKHREILPFPESLLARWDAGYAGDRSAQSNSRVLTPRERDVLAMISQGFSNKCIARAFEISPETVKTHVKRIFLKLAVNTRAEAVCRAGSLGLLGLDSGDRHGPSRKQQTHPGQGKFVQEVPDRA